MRHRSSTVGSAGKTPRWGAAVLLLAALLVASLFMFDAMDELLDVAFVQTNRQDAVLAFNGARPESVLDAVEDLPGVLAAEGTPVVASVSDTVVHRGNSIGGESFHLTGDDGNSAVFTIDFDFSSCCGNRF